MPRVLPFRPRGLVVPQLAGVPRAIGTANGGAERARLALAMLDAGVAGPEAWNWSGRTAAGFIEHALARWVAAHGGARAAEYFDLSIRLDRTLAPSWEEPAGDVPASCTFLVLEAVTCHLLAIGDTLEWLAQVHPRLPSTVWDQLAAIGRIVRIYTWDDAEEFRQVVRDGESEEDLVAFDQEFPPVVRPALLQHLPLAARSIARYRSQWPRAVRAVVDGAFRVAAAAEAFRARAPRRAEIHLIEASLGFDTDPESPALLVCEHPSDRICEAIDQDLQYLGADYPCAPAWVGVIPRPTPAAVRRAFATLAPALAAFRAFAEVLDAIPVRIREGRPLAEVLAARDEADAPDLHVRIPA